MNNTREELCTKILKYETELRDMKNMLFNENKKLFYNRILKVCEQLIRGTKEPSTCYDKTIVERGIVENGLIGLFDKKYPASHIQYEVVDRTYNSKTIPYISVTIRAEYEGGEIVNTIVIEFPNNDYDFDCYIEELKIAAIKREESIKQKIIENNKSIEDKEREQLRLLREKYDPCEKYDPLIPPYNLFSNTYLMQNKR